MDIAALEAWLERETRATDVVSASLNARLAALLDQPRRDWATGDEIPAWWYVQLFGPTEPQSALQVDGHPPKGELLPPVPWPRRMFAGRRVEFAGDLRVGDEVVRKSRVTAITPKCGRSGEMCFVTLRHELSTARGPVVVEEQDVVYRPAIEAGIAAPTAPTASTTSATPTAPRETVHQRTLVPGPTLLFRYSAVTNNAHRIHYDLPYASEVEGYPALVVNGGLSTLLLWEFARQSLEGRLRMSATRNLRPLFVDRPMTLCLGTAEGSGPVAAWVLDDTGAPALQAELDVA